MLFHVAVSGLSASRCGAVNSAQAGFAIAAGAAGLAAAPLLAAAFVAAGVVVAVEDAGFADAAGVAGVTDVTGITGVCATTKAGNTARIKTAKACFMSGENVQKPADSWRAGLVASSAVGLATGLAVGFEKLHESRV